MAPTPWKPRRSTRAVKRSLTSRGTKWPQRRAATRPPSSAAVDERENRDRYGQQPDKAQQDGPELARRGPQRYRVRVIGPNAFHLKNPQARPSAARALGIGRRGETEGSRSPLSCPAKAGYPTPQRLGSSLTASGILDRPIKSDDDTCVGEAVYALPARNQNRHVPSGTRRLVMLG